MDEIKEKVIRTIIDTSIKSFANGFELRHKNDVNNPLGTINMKKNNCFIAALGEEFIFYSAFVRSFDSSFGNLLEDLGNAIAKFSYKTERIIHSFILPEQTQHISNLLDKYEDHIAVPEVNHYKNFFVVMPPNVESFKTKHVCDNWFFDEKTKTHYLIELKAGGDLDNKKAKSEKLALLKEFFMLKNIMPLDHTINIKFATAYNKFGEGRVWHQVNIERMFSEEELLIGKDYWNFVCNDDNGFEIIFDQYKKSSHYIRDAIKRIKLIYGE